MKLFRKYALLTLYLNILINLTGFFLFRHGGTAFDYSDFTILSTLFTIVALLNLFIFFRGHDRSPESRTMHALVAVSLKFLLELVIALIWFIVIKKTSTLSLVMFFVLYLTLTLFFIFVMLKTLNNKRLNKEKLA